MAEIPHFNAPHAVSGADRADAIEHVNRVNWLFDIWDVDGIIESFTPDAVIRHPYGVVSGWAEQRKFLEKYHPLVPGVSRHNTNHIVDADGEELVVRYYLTMVRNSAPEDAETVRKATAFVDDYDGMPGIWFNAPMMDRLRRTDGGWKIVERLVGGTVRNQQYTPQQ